MNVNFEANKKRVFALFSSCHTREEIFQKIIDLGKNSASLPKNLKVPANRVSGCQSATYLISRLKEGKVFFEIDSDALISKGLAALLVAVYHGLDPETIIKTPPDYLEDLGIPVSLTPGRANGLYNIYLKMQREALKYLL